MLQDYKLGLRMLLKYPGLTLAGGLALAVAIGVGAGWYDLSGTLFSPTIPLPEGHRLVLISTQNVLTNEPEPRVAGDFIEWRRELRTIGELGAFRTATRNLVAADAAPELLQAAELTASAFRTARVPPLLGRPLLDSDEAPDAPGVVLLGYDVWQRSFGGRRDLVGSVVKLGTTPLMVIGIMPEGFGYPLNHDAWTPLSLRTSYAPLEGGAISVVGRLAPGISRQQANAEVRLFGERTAAARPATHEHLRPRVRGLAESSDMADTVDLAQLAARHLPVLLVLLIACTSVGTLIYARTATREGEIAVRSALGAGRARIVAQLFVEALVLSAVATVVGLVAADRALTWGIEAVNRSSGGAPFWMTPGLRLSTMLYAGGLAVICAAMLSLLPALRATRARVQPHLVNRSAGGATLRFGRVWTGAMIFQVALTAMGIPVAMETVNEAVLKHGIRAAFPSGTYLGARVELDRSLEETTPAFEARRAQAFAALERRVAQEPGVVAIVFADGSPGSLWRERFGEVEPSSGEPVYDGGFRTSAVGPGFFEAFDRPIVAGRGFDAGDWSGTARTVVVNQAFAREYSRETGRPSPVGTRLRYPRDAERSRTFEIVGVVRDFDLNPDDSGDEQAFVFHTAAAGTVSPFVMSVRVRGNPATLAARLPRIAADLDGRLVVRDAQPMATSIWQRDDGLMVQAGALTAVTLLVLFLSALGIFSLMSVIVSRRTREIGLRAALGASARQVLTGILSRAAVLMAGGSIAGGALVLWAVALGLGPSGRPADDVPLFAGYLAMTSFVMFAAGLLASLAPARRALRINPTDALRDA